MRAVKGKDTGPELRLRRLLTRMGVRYRLHRKDLPGSPDVALGPRRLAIFVHGCFWHGHDCARGARQPKQNAAYWSTKIARNRARDAAQQAALIEAGWRPVLLWECEMKDEAALEGRLRALLAAHPQAATRRRSPSASARAADRVA